MSKVKYCDELEVQLLNKLRNSDKPIKTKTLCADMNITVRVLKKLVTNLREEYPIVSRETDGGGYWLAKDSVDVTNFIQMITTHKNTYQETIDKMKKYLK